MLPAVVQPGGDPSKNICGNLRGPGHATCAIGGDPVFDVDQGVNPAQAHKIDLQIFVEESTPLISMLRQQPSQFGVLD